MIVYKAPRSRPVCLLTFYVLSIYLLCPEGLWNVLQNSQESVIFSNSYSEEHLWTVAFQLIVVTQSQQWKHQSCEICSKLTTKTPRRRHWHCSGVFIVNYKLISRLVMVFPFFHFEKVNIRLIGDMQFWRTSLNLFLSIFITSASSFDFSKCSKTYKKIGCYEDSNHDMVMLENYRDNRRKDFGTLSKIFWKNFEEVVHR